MPRITISYRRDDSGVITGRIFDRLVARYSREAIFRDIDDVPYGVDFRTHIDQVLASTDVLIAIIGPNWAGPSASQSRLSNEADPVRVEIETALGKGLPLIPVLVLGAAMPSVTQLPDSLRDFAYRNAVQLDAGQDFDVHMERLIRAVDRVLGDRAEAARISGALAQAPASTHRPVRRRRVLIAGSVALAAGLLVVVMSAWYLGPGQPKPMPRTDVPEIIIAAKPPAPPPAAAKQPPAGPIVITPQPKAHPDPSVPSEARTRTTPAGANPAPTVLPQVTPADPVPPSRRAPPATDRFDGYWSGRFHCEANRNNQAYGHPFVLEVKNSRITRRVDSPTTNPAEPGFNELKGEVDASGNAVFRWSGIAVGRPGQSPIPRGRSFSQEIAGKFDDDRFVGRDVSALPRVCEFELTRYSTASAPPDAARLSAKPAPAVESASPRGASAAVSSGAGAFAAPSAASHAPALDKRLQFAAERGMLVPSDLRIVPPSVDVPPGFARFSGTWVGDQRWNGGGRQALFFVEAVERSGRAAVIYSWGPPNSRTYNQRPAGWRRVFGQIAGNTLSFETPPGWNYKLTLYDDDRIFAVSEPNPSAHPPYKGARMWLTRMP